MPDFLHHARVLLTRSEDAGIWPQATAFLARHVLEEYLDRICKEHFPGLEEASRASQITCLIQFARDGVLDFSYPPEDIETAWRGLSQACHHHEYELTPTMAELDHWISQVERMTASFPTRG